MGKPFKPPAGARLDRARGTYRILSFVDDKAGIVEVTAIRHRADAYRT